MRQAGWWFALAVLLGLSASSELIAQESVSKVSASAGGWHEEMDRKPFQQSVENSTCEEAPACQVTFKSVPPHMRLVITRYNASASIVSVGSSNFVVSTLGGASDGVSNSFLHSVPTPGVSFVNEGTLMFFDAGEAPVAQVMDPAGVLDLRATISGYYIHLQ